MLSILNETSSWCQTQQKAIQWATLDPFVSCMSDTPAAEPYQQIAYKVILFHLT